jgi:hypothetical protein
LNSSEYLAAQITFTGVRERLKAILRYGADKDRVATTVTNEVRDSFRKRAAKKLTTLDDLQTFMQTWHISPFDDGTSYQNSANSLTDWGNWNKVSLVASLEHLYSFAIPSCLAQVAQAMGDYARAADLLSELVGVRIRRATIRNNTGWRQQWDSYYGMGADPHFDRDLPYTAVKAPLAVTIQGWTGRIIEWLGPALLHKVEINFLKMQLGDIILDWANRLYRTDVPSSIGRARELYKAALLVHDKKLNLALRGHRKQFNTCRGPPIRKPDPRFFARKSDTPRSWRD